jgi:hypothetical protein
MCNVVRVRTGRPALGVDEGMLTVSHFVKCFLLLVRSSDDVPRACREAGAFLAFQGTRFPTMDAQQDRRLIGIWIDPWMVDAPPEEWESIPLARQFRIRKSVGVSGIWCLCWLDSFQARGSSDLVTLRQSLVFALIEEKPRREHSGALQFVPVFDADDDGHSIVLHTGRLRELFPGLIGVAMTWDKATGAFASHVAAGEHN